MAQKPTNGDPYIGESYIMNRALMHLYAFYMNTI